MRISSAEMSDVTVVVVVVRLSTVRNSRRLDTVAMTTYHVILLCIVYACALASHEQEEGKLDYCFITKSQYKEMSGQPVVTSAD